MERSTSPDPDVGQPNALAPPELAQFAFILGWWNITGQVRNATGEWEAFRGEMVGRYILDGFVIADTWRQYASSGELAHFGETFRSYDRLNRRWVMKFLDARNSTWLDLGPAELGGVVVDSTTITFKHHLPGGGQLRVTFSDRSPTGFRWQGDRWTPEQPEWETVMVFSAERVEAGA